MPIDPTSESLLSLTQATKGLPRRRRGKKPHISTLYRWSTAGCRGVVLETVQIGGTRCTSKEALGRFFRKLTQNSGLESGQPETPLRKQRRRRREIDAAVRQLEREGL